MPSLFTQLLGGGKGSTEVLIRVWRALPWCKLCSPSNVRHLRYFVWFCIAGDWTWHMLGKQSTVELHSQPHMHSESFLETVFFFLKKPVFWYIYCQIFFINNHIRLLHLSKLDGTWNRKNLQFCNTDLTICFTMYQGLSIKCNCFFIVSLSSRVFCNLCTNFSSKVLLWGNCIWLLHLNSLQYPSLQFSSLENSKALKNEKEPGKDKKQFSTGHVTV